MPSGHLRADLSLLRQGVSLAWEFGVRSLEGLTRIAELIEHSVYEPRSLVRTPDGVAFTLLNPPLRMGAFSGLTVRWDGGTVPPAAVALALPGVRDPLPATRVGPTQPFTFPVGQRTTILLALGSPAAGRHRVRLELESVAIPPRVWFEFEDELRAEAG